MPFSVLATATSFAHTAEVTCGPGNDALDVDVTGRLAVRLGVRNVKTSWGGDRILVLK